MIGRAWLRYWPFDKLGFVGSASYGAIPDARRPAAGGLAVGRA